MEDTVELSHKYLPTITSPEGILMLALAALADGLGIVWLALDIFFGLAEILHIITDIIFTVIFSAWMISRGGKGTATNRLRQFVKKRLGWMLLDYVPFFGDLWPSWIIVVIKFLKGNERNV